MKNILMSFTPWFAYWVFLSLGELHWAIFGGLALALVINVMDGVKRSWKLLKLGTLVFFLAMSGGMLLWGPAVVGRWVGLLGPAALAIITLVSIVLKCPFTLQYARDDAPPEAWASPHFLRANYVITTAWLVAFLLMTLPSAAEFLGVKTQLLWHWVVSLACFFGASSFTQWYRKRVRRAGQSRRL